MDSKYILSGSDDANIRLWRANAWERFGPVSFFFFFFFWAF